MSEINEHELEAQRCRALLKALADTPAIRCESVFRGDGTMNLVVTASGDFAQERLIAYHIASQWSLLFPSVASKGVDFREAAVHYSGPNQKRTGLGQSLRTCFG